MFGISTTSNLLTAPEKFIIAVANFGSGIVALLSLGFLMTNWEYTAAFWAAERSLKRRIEDRKEYG